MALMPQISKENETSNYKSNIHGVSAKEKKKNKRKSNIHEEKNKPCKAQRFTFISNHFQH